MSVSPTRWASHRLPTIRSILTRVAAGTIPSGATSFGHGPQTLPVCASDQQAFDIDDRDVDSRALVLTLGRLLAVLCSEVGEIVLIVGILGSFLVIGEICVILGLQ